MSQEELERLRARVAALEAAQRTDDLLDTLLESIPDFVYFKDRSRRFVRASVAFERLFERPIEEILGCRDEDLFPPEVVAVSSADDRRVIGGEAIVDRIEGGVITPGTERWVSTTKIPWRDVAGEVVGLLGISRDITQSKKRFDELSQEVMRAKRLDFLGRLAGGIAHDFNNLLMVILVAVQELVGRLADDPDYLRDARAIEDAATNAQVLIQQLLSFNRTKSSSQHPVDVNAAIEGLTGTIERLLPSDIALELELGEVDVPIWIDPGQFTQVLLNLIVNARDAMPRGGTVSLSTQVLEPTDPEGTRSVRVSLQDTGVGMTEQTRARIFEPFFTTKSEGRGMGLGLATVISILESGEHAASIDVDSTPEQGTTFVLTFPAVNAPMPLREGAPSDADVRSLEGTVLLIDDHQGVRRAVAKMLRRCGLTVLEASNGEQAAALTKEHHDDIDLLLSDVILRDETGPEVVQRLRELRPRLPVVYMSGFSSHVFDKRGIELSSDPLLVKPFTQALLRRRVADVLPSEQHAPSP